MEHKWKQIEDDWMGDKDYQCTECKKIASQHPLVFDEPCPYPIQYVDLPQRPKPPIAKVFEME